MKGKTMNLNIKHFIAVLCLLSLEQINAQIITDRPYQTESSSIIERGDLQIESGLLISHDKENSVSIRQILIPTNLFRYGISKGIELRFLNQYETQKTHNESFQGISDIEIGTKIQILKNENQNAEIAFLSHLRIPTGTQALKNVTGVINKLSISHKLADNINLAYNFGYNYFGSNKGDLPYSLSLGIGVNKKVNVYIEPYGEISNLKNFVLNTDSGFTYLINENLQFDFSFGTGLTHRMNYIAIGCSWLLKKENK